MIDTAKNTEIKINKELNNYIQQFAEDVKLTDYNLKEKSLMASSLWAKWLAFLQHEKETLEKISETKQNLIKSKMSSVKNADSILRMKSEDKISENDENIKKLNKLAKMTQDNIDYIERALNILANFGFSIKNAIEIIKLNFTH